MISHSYFKAVRPRPVLRHAEEPCSISHVPCLWYDHLAIRRLPSLLLPSSSPGISVVSATPPCRSFHASASPPSSLHIKAPTPSRPSSSRSPSRRFPLPRSHQTPPSPSLPYSSVCSIPRGRHSHPQNPTAPRLHRHRAQLTTMPRTWPRRPHGHRAGSGTATNAPAPFHPQSRSTGCPNPTSANTSAAMRGSWARARGLRN